ncbi:PREDICTED: aspartoacylase-like [Branchiostoma belcheri]|uniref:Aspartoacylase-like n=1 Tax=Branchiostoma belcheri TaxID=7741 RepID=A0A6P5ACJ4_BRABE|nr:PREDICTED: aspartoacylase-like [Branchiostoma belcheri]
MSAAQVVRRVAVFGGTHGNEMSGVYLVKRWLQNQEAISRPSFQTVPCIANPRAVERCRRYIDVDLKMLKMLIDDLFYSMEAPPSTAPYEVHRAVELNKKFGAKGESFDVIIDLHNTTSNMGNCLIIGSSTDSFTLQMAKYLVQWSGLVCPVFLTENPAPHLKMADTTSMSAHGIGLELGAQPQGVLLADVYLRHERLVHTCLDFIHKFNQGEIFPPATLEVYRILHVVDYPRNKDNELTAMIHPELQDKDWHPLKPGDPMFLSMDGKTIKYEGESTIYPAFVNEAAYYEKGIAFWATQKETLNVQELQVKA